MAKQSRSWAAILTLQQELQKIRQSNDYLTDIGASVWTTDGQRPDDDAAGLMIYTDGIVGVPNQRPAKPARELNLSVEFVVGVMLDSAQLMAHAIVEDIENCLEAYNTSVFGRPGMQTTALKVAQIDFADRPDGAAFIAGWAKVTAEYFR